MSFADAEAARVNSILKGAVDQLSVLALLPHGRRLRETVKAGARRASTANRRVGGGGTGLSPTDSALASVLIRQVDAEDAFAAAFRRGEGDSAAPKVAEATRRTSRELLAARRLVEEAGATDVGEEDDGATGGVPMAAISAVLASLETRADARRARLRGAPGSAGESRLGSAASGARPGTSGDGQLPLETVSEALEETCEAVLARLATRVEQEAARAELSKRLETRLQEGTSQAKLLEEELSRVRESRHEETERAKALIESLKEAKTEALKRASRQEATLRGELESEMKRLQEARDESVARLQHDKSTEESKLKETIEEADAEEEKIRRRRDIATRDIEAKTKEMDNELLQQQKYIDELQAQIKRDTQRIEALAKHFSLIDANANATAAEEERNRAERAEAELIFRTTFGPPATRIERWWARLNQKWADRKKKSKKSSKKKKK